MARRPVIEFWYEFASTYSYLAAMRIEALAEEAGRRCALAALPARPDLRRAGLEHLALQPLPGQGPLHVARHGARGGPARPALRAARPVSAEQPRSPRGSPSSARARLAPAFTQGRLSRPNSARAAASRSPRRSARSFQRLGLDGPGDPQGGAGEPTRPRLKAVGGGGPLAAASSARRPSSPRTARCSGATTASSRRSPGPRASGQGRRVAPAMIARYGEPSVIPAARLRRRPGTARGMRRSRRPERLVSPCKLHYRPPRPTRR